MYTRRYVTPLIAAATVLVPTLGSAQDAPRYECRNGSLQRRVEVKYETAVSVPCEVHYTKDIEAPGEAQVLWRALNEEGYCEAKAQEFVARLEGWGWNCGAAASEDATPDESQADDTEALAPSQPDAGTDPR